MSARQIPEDVAVAEYDVPGKVRRPSTPPSTQPAPAPEPTPESPGTSETAPDPLAILTGDDPSLSYVVRSALDDLLLNVIQQLQHDLNHGPAATRSKIASQFLPRIMRALDKEEDEGDRELEKLREEMERLNHEMLYGEPKLYTASAQTPDSDDLPIVDPQTGRTISPQQQSA